MDTSSRRLQVSTVVLSLVCLSHVAPAGAAEIIDLGSDSATDINEAGQVAGKIFSNNNYYPVLWPNGSTTPQLLAGNNFGGGLCSYCSAWAINEQGQVTGGAKWMNFVEPRGFLRDDGVMTDLGMLGTGVNSIGWDINDAGQVVGAAWPSQPAIDEHAFLRENGTMQDLGTFGGTRSSAVAINAGGQVLVRAVGFVDAPSIRAFLWKDGTEPQQLVSALPNGVSEVGNGALNDLGQAVGYSQAGGPTRATLWQGGRALDIGRDGLSTIPADINNRGQVVGTADPSTCCGATLSFFWQNGRFQDLCALVNCAGAGWTAVRANGINDRGDVVGRGTIGGQGHAFLVRGLAEPYAAGRFTAFAGAAGTSLVARLRNPTPTGAVVVERVNSTNGVALANLNFFGAGHSGRQVLALPNIGGGAAGDLAVLATRRSDGYSRVEIRDGDTGTLIKAMNILSGLYIPVWLFEMPDLDNNDKVDLGLLVIRASDGRLLVRNVGSISGAGIGSTILFSPGLTAVMAAGLPDLDNSGAPEIAVLAEKPSTGRFLAEIRNASGAAAARTIYFTEGFDPVNFRIGADTDGDTLPDLVVLMRRRSDRRVVVEMRSAFGAPAPRKVAFSAGYEAASFTGIGSTDTDSTPEWVAALERVADRRPYTQLKNAVGAANLQITAYHTSAFAVQHLLALPDSDGIGGPDIAVIAHRKTDGRVRVEIKNARGGGTARSFFFSP